MPKQTVFEIQSSKSVVPNGWDALVILIVLGILIAFGWGSMQMQSTLEIGQQIPISLDPSALPGYAIQSVMRMFIAMGFSLLFTFLVAPLAAKNVHFERFIIPFIDIMESVPVLAFLAIAVMAFIHMFPNSRLGPECASIFAVFTSQVWNMALSLYQSLRTLPQDYRDCADSFHLSGWSRFWRIEVPYATPSLLWNMMISMSAGWFFVVASEAISVANQDILLPGIGSYISVAIQQANLPAVGYAIGTMFVVILIYDQLLFRPLLAWSEKFKPEIEQSQDEAESWFYDLLNKTRFIKTQRRISMMLIHLFTLSPGNHIKKVLHLAPHTRKKLSKSLIIIWNGALVLGTLASLIYCFQFISTKIEWQEILHVLYLGGVTGFKVLVLIICASLFWVPIGVWIGLNASLRRFIQPLAQFLAAFPANLFYPLAVILILKFNLNVDVWTAPLMILGTQWYILFNVIAAAAAIPKDISQASKNFHIKGWLWWRRIMLPVLFPYYVTGAMAAAGGCWNASIISEVVQWGPDTLIATGLGSYITKYAEIGDFPRLGLGIAVMSLYVVLINRVIWHRLYNLAESRYTLE